MAIKKSGFLGLIMGLLFGIFVFIYVNIIETSIHELFDAQMGSLELIPWMYFGENVNVIVKLVSVTTFYGLLGLGLGYLNELLRNRNLFLRLFITLFLIALILFIIFIIGLFAVYPSDSS